jgi:hypothetical protein
LGLGDEAGGFKLLKVGESDAVSAVAPPHGIAFGADDLAVIEPVVATKQQQQQARGASGKALEFRAVHHGVFELAE